MQDGARARIAEPLARSGRAFRSAAERGCDLVCFRRPKHWSAFAHGTLDGAMLQCSRVLATLAVRAVACWPRLRRRRARRSRPMRPAAGTGGSDGGMAGARGHAAGSAGSGGGTAARAVAARAIGKAAGARPPETNCVHRRRSTTTATATSIASTPTARRRAAAAAGLTCTGGACLRPGATGCPSCRASTTCASPSAATRRSSTSSRSPARATTASTRCPKPDDVLVGENGELAVKNAIYRCAGDRPFQRARGRPAALCTTRRSGRPAATLIHDYERDRSRLGARLRVSDAGGRAAARLPHGRSATAAAASGTPTGWCRSTRKPTAPTTWSARSGATPAARGLPRRRHRVLRAARPGRARLPQVYEEDWNGVVSVFFVRRRRVRQARTRTTAEDVLEFGERFKVFASAGAEARVPLHRVLYTAATPSTCSPPASRATSACSSRAISRSGP